MAATPYFLHPFAGSGTTTPIPTEGGAIGAINYQYGFTPTYELDLNTDPDSLPIPRPQFNQLMLDITTAIQRLQLQGAPLFVLPAVGSPPVGGPASYPLYARVAYDAGAPYGYQIWESQVGTESGGNFSVPGTNNDWVIISGGRGIAVGSYIDSASPNGYVGALLCDGSPYLRTEYPLLFEALTLVATCVTDSTAVISVPPEVIALVTPYLVGTTIACTVEGSNIPDGAYVTGVGIDNITISASASSSGSFVLRFLPYGWGISGGLTTFGVPNCLRTVSVASGGSGNSVLGNKLSNKGGTNTYKLRSSDLAPHSHTIEANTPAQAAGAPGGFPIRLPRADFTQQTQLFPANVGAQTESNIIQPSNVVYRYIKY